MAVELMSQLSATLSALPIPVLAVGATGRIVAMNTPAERLLGGALNGRHFATVLRQPGVIDVIEGVLAGGQSAQAGYISHDNGVETRWKAVVAKAAAGHDTVIVSFLDETSLADADAMRRDFVANVSHELKTPLTALMGFIETLQGPARDDPEARDRFLTIMAREAGRMDRLTQDLLSLSRVERDERRRPDAQVEMAALVRAGVQAMAPAAQARNVTLTIQTAPDLATLRGDADQLAQVLSNLIENAIKYGRDGGIVTITLSQLGHDPRLQGRVQRIDVADEGAGIDPRHLARLTERFYRVDSHRSRDVGGTGLGLAIAKHIANRHRGRLEISSTPGQGSIFSLVLPAT
jgi:two-component system, OmpR family, phosphate regulon sensor histidine kinase PhoR